MVSIAQFMQNFKIWQEDAVNDVKKLSHWSNTFLSDNNYMNLCRISGYQSFTNSFLGRQVELSQNSGSGCNAPSHDLLLQLHSKYYIEVPTGEKQTANTIEN